MLANSVQNIIRRSMKAVNTPQYLMKQLEKPSQILMDKLEFDGEYYDAYRVQHNDILGPFKGGIRFHPQVDLEECTALATWMTYKCALHNLPLGGGKGGVSIDARNLTKSQQILLSEKYATSFADHLGEDIDIPAPDVGTTGELMDHMNATVCRLTGRRWNFTGKTLDNYGCKGREPATGAGVAYALDNWARVNSIDLNGATYAIQGFGNVGKYCVKHFEERGMILVQLGDIDGVVRDISGSGLQYLDLLDSLENTGSVLNCEGSEIVEKEWFEESVDVLVPAALEMAINEHNVHKIDTQVVIEAANGPVTFDAEHVLVDKNIDVVPDIYANSGGVIVSYWEYLQNVNKHPTEYLEEKQILSNLDNMMMQTFDSIVELRSQIDAKDYRTATYGVALENIRSKCEEHTANSLYEIAMTPTTVNLKRVAL